MFMRCLLIVGLVFCLTAATADAAKGKKKKKKGGVQGVVVAVEKNQDGDSTITVKPRVRKKANPSPGEQAEKKIKVGKDTKFELVSGKKGARETKAGSLDDVKQGERVLVRGGESGAAESVMIQQGRKKKKAS